MEIKHINWEGTEETQSFDGINITACKASRDIILDEQDLFIKFLDDLSEINEAINKIQLPSFFEFEDNYKSISMPQFEMRINY